jgi:hypothetical protein
MTVRNVLKDGEKMPVPGYTPPVQTQLKLNVSTSAFGSVRCELIDADGNPIPGYSLDDCDPIFGDSIDRVVTWDGESDLESLAGTPLRIRFALQDADLYAMKFE